MRSPASTSGRPFGSPPSHERTHTGGFLQALYPVTFIAQRTSQLEAVRGNKQERAKRASEGASTSHGEQNMVSQSAGFVTGLVNDLLYGAASRMERGQTTCIKCKGSGACACPNCKGQGIVQPEKLRKAADPVRQAANKVSSLLGGSNSNDYTHMLRSNRCQKCHGSGKCTCSTCQGHGFRGDDYE